MTVHREVTWLPMNIHEFTIENDMLVDILYVQVLLFLSSVLSAVAAQTSILALPGDLC